jgi:hypothetical protein
MNDQDRLQAASAEDQGELETLTTEQVDDRTLPKNSPPPPQTTEETRQ